MKYYPVLIPTLNRYEHFKRCVESLSRNTHADKTELIIGLDYPPSKKYEDGYKKIKEYIPTITGFAKVTVFERDHNWGASKNFIDLREYAYSKYEAIISTEDDNEFSPCFLDYMNKALEKYQDNNTVLSVTGFNNTHNYKVTKNNVFFAPTGNHWGIGRWRGKQQLLIFDDNYEKNILFSFKKSFKLFKVSPNALALLIAMYKTNSSWGDLKMSCKNILEGRLQLRPRISMVRNWGNDGSGLHSGSYPQYEQQEIQTDRIFNIDDIDLIVNKSVYKSLFFSPFSHNKVKAWMQILKIVLKYLIIRIKKL